ncbi:hypothetical protein L228DRAFT_242807 [Xylona heveae TC161]|uniref:Zn(2)-C6 fungal-type domain-containing protein n=1 Tax=Xylona heveae (strain CBS 132557 / TC161) TaxID=1328760 RepID=A0A165JKF7_XYLHT|nr:hypothetical protein L228DRAFT_242807 [Xylona heveae TC161]KZF26348.1 hypothetical protein L228DRAFT_242807 [Xylona heveae TC161]
MDGLPPPHPTSTAGSDSGDHSASNNNPNKRKPDGANQPTQRAKRNRYISIACNECKRRKIKCNGQTPCQRCGNLGLECLYAPNCCGSSFKESDEFKRMDAQIRTLQDQVDNLFASMSALRSSQDINTPTIESGSYPRRLQSRSVSVSQPSIPNPSSPLNQIHQATQDRRISRTPRFQGPTSSAFGFDVARSSLQTMGITSPEDIGPDGALPRNALPAPSPPHSPIKIHSTKDPIWGLSRQDVMRLCQVYEEEVGVMYPVLSIDFLMRHANLLYTFIEAAARSGFAQPSLPGADQLQDKYTNVLKMVLATALMIEGDGQSEVGERLYETVRPHAENFLWAPVEVRDIVLLVVISFYHFHRDEETLAWRTNGLVVRLCLELGLHRRECLDKLFAGSENEQERRARAIGIFWSIYVLDRRWSLSTGLPFALQDSDIDPSLPEPDASSHYLLAMIAYSRIGSRVWKSVAGLDGSVSEIRRDEMGFLDYQTLQWHNSIPENLRFYHFESPQGTNLENRGLARLRVILYLRANQMRILIYRPVLHSATSIVENRGCAQTVVDVAKDTIRVLSRLNQETDIYRTQQVCFNYFLVSALAVLFLAVSHAPAQFSSLARDEFYMALDLVKGFSTKSYISKRLWKTIEGLKVVAPKLGLGVQHFGQSESDAHSSAAMAMAGLAGHPVGPVASYPDTAATMNSAVAGTTPVDGYQMSNELTHLFEAAGVLNGGTEGINGYNGAQSVPIPRDGSTHPNLEGQQEAPKVIRHLF